MTGILSNFVNLNFEKVFLVKLSQTRTDLYFLRAKWNEVLPLILKVTIKKNTNWLVNPNNNVLKCYI